MSRKNTKNINLSKQSSNNDFELQMMSRRTLRRNNSVNSISRKSIVSLLIDQDLKTHPIFCQLSLLNSNNLVKKPLWKEKSRLIKYIETVEDNGLWSKPYVSSISLNKLGNLRDYFEKGTVIFNCMETELDLIFGT